MVSKIGTRRTLRTKAMVAAPIPAYTPQSLFPIQARQSRNQLSPLPSLTLPVDDEFPLLGGRGSE